MHDDAFEDGIHIEHGEVMLAMQCGDVQDAKRVKVPHPARNLVDDG